MARNPAATASLAGSSGVLALRGALTAATVPHLHGEGRRAIESGGTLQIDLSGVTSADSAGLALLIDWLAFAADRGCTLRYEHLPASLVALAGLSEVSGLLGVERPAA